MEERRRCLKALCDHLDKVVAVGDLGGIMETAADLRKLANARQLGPKFPVIAGHPWHPWLSDGWARLPQGLASLVLECSQSDGVPHCWVVARFQFCDECPTGLGHYAFHDNDGYRLIECPGSDREPGSIPDWHAEVRCLVDRLRADMRDFRRSHLDAEEAEDRIESVEDLLLQARNGQMTTEQDDDLRQRVARVRDLILLARDVEDPPSLRTPGAVAAEAARELEGEVECFVGNLTD